MKCMAPIGIILALLVIVGRVDSQIYAQHDECIDEIFVHLHEIMSKEFPQLDNFTSTLPSSRHLFQNMLTQRFTPDTLQEYCSVYQPIRREYDRCSDSKYKTAVLSGFGLVDQICVRRLADYANGLMCLQTVHQDAADSCRPKCTRFQDASHAYLHSEESPMMIDKTTLMAGDCEYLKCWTECRQPVLAQQCGNETASLELNSLIIAYSSLYGQYQPTFDSTSEPFHSGEQPIPRFPDSCLPFVREMPVDTDQDETSTITTDVESASTRGIVISRTFHPRSHPLSAGQAIAMPETIVIINTVLAWQFTLITVVQ